MLIPPQSFVSITFLDITSAKLASEAQAKFGEHSDMRKERLRIEPFSSQLR
jgi:hypothetical protein